MRTSRTKIWCSFNIKKITILLNPIIPNSSEKVMNALNINLESRNLFFLQKDKLLPNEIKINQLDILFKKIS